MRCTLYIKIFLQSYFKYIEIYLKQTKTSIVVSCLCVPCHKRDLPLTAWLWGVSAVRTGRVAGAALTRYFSVWILLVFKHQKSHYKVPKFSKWVVQPLNRRFHSTTLAVRLVDIKFRPLNVWGTDKFPDASWTLYLYLLSDQGVNESKIYFTGRLLQKYQALCTGSTGFSLSKMDQFPRKNVL